MPRLEISCRICRLFPRCTCLTFCRCRRSRLRGRFFSGAFRLYPYGNCGVPTGHLRQNRHSGRPMVAHTNRFERGQSFCTLSAGSGALAVFSALSIPGHRNKCIRRRVRAPLKKERRCQYEYQSNDTQNNGIHGGGLTCGAYG